MKRAPENERRRVCEHCLAVYFVKPSKVSRFCSKKCKDEHGRTRPKNDPRPCKVCGSTFTPGKSSGNASHCSKKCEWIARGGAEFNARISRATSKQRADAMRDTGLCVNTYRKRGGRHEHRQVAEEILGRKLERGEVVHHKDGNKRNNDPSNLEIMTQGEHMREHGLGIAGKTLWWKPWEKTKHFKGGAK